MVWWEMTMEGVVADGVVCVAVLSRSSYDTANG